MQHHKTVQMCVSAECDTTTATKLPTASGVNSVFFKRHLKLFEEPENIGFADLGNQNLRTYPVAPNNGGRLLLVFLMATAFWPRIENFFQGERITPRSRRSPKNYQRGPDPFAPTKYHRQNPLLNSFATPLSFVTFVTF